MTKYHLTFIDIIAFKFQYAQLSNFVYKSNYLALS